MKIPARNHLAAGALCFLSLLSPAEGRTWTNTQGKTLEAEFVKLDGQKAVLTRAGGQTVTIPLNQLSKADQDFIAGQGTAAAPANPADNYKQPWPRTVKCPDNFKVETIKEEKGEYIYETPHFRFICDAKLGAGMIKRLGLLFEATMTIPPKSRPTCMKSSAPTRKTGDWKERRAFSWEPRGPGTGAEFWCLSSRWASSPWGARTSLTGTRMPPPSFTN